VRPLNPEEGYQRATVGGMLREADRTNDTAAASASGAVVVHEAIPSGEDRLAHERREPVRVTARPTSILAASRARATIEA
jgi:hypothetical protein